MKNSSIIGSVYPFPFFIGEGHDTNFSLLKGKEIFSSEEGKINQIVMNNLDKFPQKSMMTGFKENNIEARDVDHWVFGGKGIVKEEDALKFFFSKFKAKNYEYLKKNKRIHYVNHHLAHTTLGIYGSGLFNGTFISMDDGGDESFPYDTVWGKFSKNKIKTIQKGNKGGWGITRFHNYICEAVGYLANVDNGKVMGLAGYGRVVPNLYEKLSRFLILSSDGFTAKCLLRRKKNDLSDYNLSKLKLDAYQQYKILHKPKPPVDLIDVTKYYSNVDVAATGQKVVEEVTLKMIKNILIKNKSKNLICSGGFFQNVSLNKRLLELGLKNVYVPSAPNDAGLSLGAALYVKMKILKQKRPTKKLTPYLGASFNKNDIEKLLLDYNLKFDKSKTPWVNCAKLLKKGKVIGWFQGKAELGPRSLGARSVLADPRKAINKARVNQLLKKRDWFMPYAPSILEDKMNFFFNKNFKTPYMSFALKIKNNSNLIPAAVHVDDTCRPQSVNKQTNSKFYKVIKEFYKLTGVPALLNTSFNRHGIATISTPRQAIDHLFNGCIDVLIIDDFIVYPNKKLKKNHKKILSEKYYLFIENLINLLTAVKKRDKDFKKIIINSAAFLKKYNIKFLNNNKNLKINNNIFSSKYENREELIKRFMPIYKNIINE